jgi:Tol biopolymer transport system component
LGSSVATRTRFSRLGRALAAAGLWAVVGGSLAAQGEAERTLRWFKREEPLRLDVRYALIKPARAVRGARALSALRDYGVAEIDVRRFAVAPWLTVQTPASARAPAAYEKWIARVASDARFDFVSPQWIDRHGGAAAALPVLYVGFDPALSATEAGRILALARVGTIADDEAEGVPGVKRLRPFVRDGAALLRLSARLAEHSAVRFAEPEFFYFGHPQATTPAPGRNGEPESDPDLPAAWHLRAGATAPLGAAGVEQAWRITRGDPSIGVLILDGGVVRRHPDLDVAGAFDALATADGPGPADGESDGHGTAVAGVVGAAADNEIGACGVAPHCSLFSARVFRVERDRRYIGTTAALARALAYGRAHGVRATNFSAYQCVPSAFAAAAYERARTLGMVHFAAAGNRGALQLPFPSSLPFVRSIGALTPAGDLAAFSNCGAAVDFAAPGVGVFTTDLPGRAGFASGDFALVHGTSFAAPIATGAAALVMSARPDLRAGAVEAILAETATDLGAAGRDPAFGYGAIHAGRAVFAAAAREPAAGPLRRISSASSGLSGGDASFGATLSADGRHTVFSSASREFGGEFTGRAHRLFARVDGESGLRALRLGPPGAATAGACEEPALSHDGRFVAFTSYAAWSPLDRNGVRDVYVHDRDADENGVYDEPEPGAVRTQLVSRRPGGGAADGASRSPSLSADGRRLAFASRARLLAHEDLDDAEDVYFAVRTDDEWTVVSRPSAAPPGTPVGDASQPSLSGDGRTLAFVGTSDGLAGESREGRSDVYWVKLDSAGAPTAPPSPAARRVDGRSADGRSGSPVLSADGEVLVFVTTATNLGAAPLAPGFVRLAVRRFGTLGYVFDPAEPPDPRPEAGVAAAHRGSARARVAWPALVFGETPALTEFGNTAWFVGVSPRSGRRGREIYRVAAYVGARPEPVLAEGPGGARASGPAVSADGKTLVFDTDDEALVPEDGNGRRDVFLLAPAR